MLLVFASYVCQQAYQAVLGGSQRDADQCGIYKRREVGEKEVVVQIHNGEEQHGRHVAEHYGDDVVDHLVGRLLASAVDVAEVAAKLAKPVD